MASERCPPSSPFLSHNDRIVFCLEYVLLPVGFEERVQIATLILCDILPDLRAELLSDFSGDSTRNVLAVRAEDSSKRRSEERPVGKGCRLE